MTGMGFIYTNKECHLARHRLSRRRISQKTGETPYGLLEAFKRIHRSRRCIEGSEVKEYAAHLIPEGGYKAIPQLFGDGWVVVGDAAQLNNAIHREGSNLAMTSGRFAAEAIFQIKSRRDPMTKQNLSLYKKMHRRSLRHEGLEEIQGYAGAAAYAVAKLLPHLSAARVESDGEFPARRRNAEAGEGEERRSAPSSRRGR